MPFNSIRGMIMRGMRFDNPTSIYVAAGKIYTAERYMAPLKQMFPHLETKETLASEEEFFPFKGRIPLIGCGGISSGKDAYEKIRVGATLVQLYKVFAYEGLTLIPQIKVFFSYESPFLGIENNIYFGLVNEKESIRQMFKLKRVIGGSIFNAIEGDVLDM